MESVSTSADTVSALFLSVQTSAGGPVHRGAGSVSHELSVIRLLGGTARFGKWKYKTLIIGGKKEKKI